MSESSGVKCQRCQQPLSADSGYCVSCGFDNTDIASKKFAVDQAYDKRMKHLGFLRNIFRFFRIMR